jgi:PST family polysaccharide transporter
MRLRQLLLQGFRWSFAQSVGTLVVQLGTLVILSRLLTPGDFGAVAVAVSLVGSASLLVELGVGPALIQRRDLTHRHVGSALWLSLILAVVLMAILQSTSSMVLTWLGIAQASAIFRLIALIVVLQPVVTILSSLARRNLDMRDAAAADLVGTVVGYSLVSITLAHLGLGAWALAIGQVVQLSITCVTLIVSQRRRISLRAGFRELRDVLSFGAYFSIGRIANYAAQKLDRAMVGIFLSVDAAGNYQRVLNMLQVFGPLLAGPLDAIMFPLLSRIQDDAARLRRAYRATTALAALITMPASVVLCVSAPVLIPLILGPQWHGAIAPAQIMAWVLFFRTNDSITATLARAVGKVRERAALQVLYAALSLGSIFALKDHGLTGIAAGLLGVTVLNFCLMSFLVRRLVRMSLADNFAPLLPGAIVATCLAAPPGGLYIALGDALFGPLWMAVCLAAMMSAYVALLLTLPASIFPPEIAALRAEVRMNLLNPALRQNATTAVVGATGRSREA